MTLQRDWNTGKFLEWNTDLPYNFRPRISPTFSIQNIECNFHFCRVYAECTGYNYHVYLKSKSECHILKPLSLATYAHIDISGTYIERLQQTFRDFKYSILSFSESSIPDKGRNLSSGYMIKLHFMFQDEDGPLLHSETRFAEKTTQVDLMLSLQTDLEYLSLDFGELMKRGDHADVQLLCNGGNIPAHRAILAARSQTFSDMFQENTKESQGDLINFSTTELSVMELCLEFVYKGKILKLPIEKASDLYELGHVLKISSLWKTCADLMVSNVCEDNYITYLILADKYNDDCFKCRLVDYVSDHVDLLKSESWKKFCSKYMKTAIDVYQKYMFK